MTVPDLMGDYYNADCCHDTIIKKAPDKSGAFFIDNRLQSGLVMLWRR
jgi:hypothetical protein